MDLQSGCRGLVSEARLCLTFAKDGMMSRLVTTFGMVSECR